MDLFLLNMVTTLSISKLLEPLILYISYKFYMSIQLISPEFSETIFFPILKFSHFLDCKPHFSVQIQNLTLWAGVTQRLSQTP